MKRLFFGLLAAISIGLFARVFYLVLSSPAQPAFGAADRQAVIAQLDHIFRMAAYSITWAIQLGYVAWLGLKGQAQKRTAAAVASGSH